MKDKGLLLDQETNDLIVKVARDASDMITGGLVLGDVTRQNQKNILFMHAAEIKESPTVGVGIDSMLLSEDTLLYKHKVREQLEADGQRVSYLDIKVSVNNEVDILIHANY